MSKIYLISHANGEPFENINGNKFKMTHILGRFEAEYIAGICFCDYINGGEYISVNDIDMIKLVKKYILKEDSHVYSTSKQKYTYAISCNNFSRLDDPVIITCNTKKFIKGFHWARSIISFPNYKVEIIN